MYANPPSPANKRKRADKEASKPKKKRRSSFSEGTDGAIPFVVGQVYLRQHIHEHYGGSKRGGISIASGYPFIFLFAHSKKSKSFYYFRDGFQANNTSYIYTTIGREGDLNAIAVNAAIKDHQVRQKKVLLFSHPFNNGHVRYLGEGCYKSHKILTFLRDKQERLTSVEFTFVVISEQTSQVDARAVSGDFDDESDSQEAAEANMGRISLRHSDGAISRVRKSNSSDELRRSSVSSSEYERALSRKSSSLSVNSEFSFESSGEQTFRSSTLRSTDSSDSISHMTLQLSIHDSDKSPSMDDSCSVVLTPSTANDSTGVDSDDVMSISSHSTPCADMPSRPGTPAGAIVLAPFHGVSLRSNSAESRTAHTIQDTAIRSNNTTRREPNDGMDYIATIDNNEELFLREEMFLQGELDNLRRGEFTTSTEPTTDALFERYIQELSGTDIFDSFNFDGIFSDSFPNEHHL